MTTLTGALCAGLHLAPLFESTDLFDHAEAREICLRCPAIEACRELLVETSSLAYGGGKGGYIQGTWAGQLFGRQGQPRPRVLPLSTGGVDGGLPIPHGRRNDASMTKRLA